jgi:putative transcriptional regulator
MPIHYKIDVLTELKKKGYSTYRLRKDNLLPQSTIKRIKDGEPIDWKTLTSICTLLDCQPGDILIYEKEQ